jgi:hypothetical protein
MKGLKKRPPKNQKLRAHLPRRKAVWRSFRLPLWGWFLGISVPARYTPFGNVSTVNTALPGFHFEERFLLEKYLSIAEKQGFKTVHGIVLNTSSIEGAEMIFIEKA